MVVLLNIHTLNYYSFADYNIPLMIQRTEYELFLNQRARVIWFTGLSGAGKTTLSIALADRLFMAGHLVRVLDADQIRTGLNDGLGYTLSDRFENIRRVSETARLFLDTGIITICSLISPLKSMRDMAQKIIGLDDFIEIYVSTPIEVCEMRDVKGLYAKARKGQIMNFTGISDPYEPPINPALSIDTSSLSVAEAIHKLVELINPLIRYV